MTTLGIEIAMMRYYGVRTHLIIPNIYWGMGLSYECDLVVLTNHNYATEIEIKISKQDLLKDKKKHHCHNSNLFKYLYFAVPEKLKEIALTEIPERAGLYVIYKSDTGWIHVRKEKNAIKNKHCQQWDEGQRNKLASLGAMRIMGLKESIDALLSKSQLLLQAN